LEFKKINSQFSNLVTLGVFLITLVFVIITLTSAIFPNLLLTSFGGNENYANIDPFEMGIWAFPLLITNFIIFGLAILYLKKRLPDQIISSIRFIFNFEISPKITFFVLTILIGIYLVFSVGELFDGKFQADYTERVKVWVENFSFTKIDTEGYNAPGIGGYLHSMLGYISIQVFGNVKVVPLIASTTLLVLTYFITYEITKKKICWNYSLCYITSKWRIFALSHWNNISKFLDFILSFFTLSYLQKMASFTYTICCINTYKATNSCIFSNDSFFHLSSFNIKTKENSSIDFIWSNSSFRYNIS